MQHAVNIAQVKSSYQKCSVQFGNPSKKYETVINKNFVAIAINNEW